MTEISLAELLESRDNRAAFQKELIAAYNQPLISFTVNMPGAVKNRPQAGIIFNAGTHAIREALAGRILYHKLRHLPTGHEGYFVCELEAGDLKTRMCRIEEEHPLGRLFDIDVLDRQARHQSRTQLGLAKRACLLCGGDGDACASRRVHPIGQLLEHIDRMVEAYAEKEEPV